MPGGCQVKSQPQSDSITEQEEAVGMCKLARAVMHMLQETSCGSCLTKLYPKALLQLTNLPPQHNSGGRDPQPLLRSHIHKQG